MLFKLVILSTLALAQADTAAAGLGEQVSKLVRQLDAPTVRERDEAEQSLIALGPAILEFLPTTTTGLSAEKKQRLARIRQTLEQTRIESAAKAAPITLPGDAIPLSKALAAIEKQSGNKIIDLRERFGQKGDDPSLKLALDKVPFWPALDQVLDQAGMTVYPFGEESGLGVIAAPAGQLPRHGRAAYSGPFRIEAIQLAAERDLRKTASGSLRVLLDVAWEPRLHPIVLEHGLKGLMATGDDGSSLQAQQPQGTLEAQVAPGSTATEFTLLLELPPRSVAQIKSLQGELTALMPGEIQTFQFSNLLDIKKDPKKFEQHKGQATVTLDDVRKNGEIWEVHVRVRFDDAARALESHRGWIFNNEAYLIGPDKKQIPNAGFETTRQTENEIGLAYLFEVPGKPAQHTFVYKTPAAIVPMPVKYELNDLKLP